MIQLLGIGILAAVLYFSQREIYKRLWQKGLKVDLAFEKEHLFVGETGVLREIIENGKRLPLSMLKVRFCTNRNLIFDGGKGSRTTDQYYRNDVFHVGGGERIVRTLEFMGGGRGFFGIEGIDVAASDLLMTYEMSLSVPLHRVIYVYPKPFDSAEFRLSLQQMNGEILAKRRILEDPFEYRGIREYQPYDDMRNINWKATAKTGELKVNQKNDTVIRSVNLFLNVEDDGVLKKTDCVEAAIRMMAGLGVFFLRQGFRVSCYGNGTDAITNIPLHIEANAGKGGMDGIYKGLARLSVSGEVPNFRTLFEEKLLRGKKKSFTCIVSPNQYPDFVELLERFQDTGADWLWLYPIREGDAAKLPERLVPNIRLIPIEK